MYNAMAQARRKQKNEQIANQNTKVENNQSTA